MSKDVYRENIMVEYEDVKFPMQILKDRKNKNWGCIRVRIDEEEGTKILSKKAKYFLDATCGALTMCFDESKKKKFWKRSFFCLAGFSAGYFAAKGIKSLFDKWKYYEDEDIDDVDVYEED